MNKHLCSLLLLFLFCGSICQAQTADAFFKKAETAEQARDFPQALELYLQANKAYLAEGRGATAEAAQSLHNTGRTYANLQQPLDARSYDEKALEIRKKLFGEASEPYITSLNNYALTYSLEEKYAEAMKHQQKVVQLLGELKTPHPQAGLFLLNMGRFYYLNGDLTQAAASWEEALPRVEKFGDLYEFLLEQLGAIYSDQNDMEHLERLLALTEEHNRHELTKVCTDPDCMLERALYFATTGQNASAKEWFLKALALPLSGEMKVKAHETYADFLGSATGDYEGSADYFRSAAQALGDRSERWAGLMYKAGLYSFLAAKYPQAIDFYKQVIAFYRSYSGPSAQARLVACREDLANAYSGLRDYESAVPFYREVMEYYEAAAPSDENYPKAIVRLATAEKFAKRYDEALAHYKQALEIYRTMGKTEAYAQTVDAYNLCCLYSRKGERMAYDESARTNERNALLDTLIRQETARLALTKSYLGSLSYARSLAVIAGSYAMKADYAQSVTYYKQYIEAVRTALRDKFRMQNEKERMLVWTEEKKNIQELLELLVSLPAGHEASAEELAALAYDAELLSKGILLTSAVEFEQILRQTDARLVADYKQTQSNDEKLKQWRQTARTQAEWEQIQSLARANEALQLGLYKACAEYADYTDYISYSWQDVQQSLTDTDVAIEFAAIQVGALSTESFMTALVLTKDMPRPAALRLCNLAVAEGMENDSSLFDNREAGPIVWGALRPYLAGKRRILFSADGSFNRIGIEYLLYENAPLTEKFDVYRLSSTKEICYHKKSVPVRHVALFGSIDYNEGGSGTNGAVNGMNKAGNGANEHGSGTNEEMKKAGIGANEAGTEGAETRVSGGEGLFADLPATRREVSEIRAVLQQNQVDRIAFRTGTEADEEAFKRLSDSEVNLLHIATHGVYHESDQTTEDESMSNCQLVFAGANLGETEAGNDGLVSAAEVARMNLRQCDLAVLSACETGLGKLGGDGVFGLQRGFKNAGVHALLMSLKKVYDESTADLMIGFYKYLLAGSSKCEALKRAQQDVRKKGYADPKFWATFILLDALD